jgi:hypothetical protein
MIPNNYIYTEYRVHLYRVHFQKKKKNFSDQLLPLIGFKAERKGDYRWKLGVTAQKC